MMIAAVAALPASKNGLIPLNCERAITDDYTFRWGFTNERIEFEIQANTTGWVGLAMGDFDINVADVWMGGYDDITGKPYLQVLLFEN